MKHNTPPYQPMAIPFRLDHFRFRRQAELEKALSQSPFYARMDAICASALEVQEKEAVEQGFPVALAAFPVLHAAVCCLQTVARQAHKIDVHLGQKPTEPTSCRAVLQGERLVFVLAPASCRRPGPKF